MGSNGHKEQRTSKEEMVIHRILAKVEKIVANDLITEQQNR